MSNKAAGPPKSPPAKIAARIAELDRSFVCTTPFCGRKTMASAGVGFAELLCKRCIQHRARHGSPWAGSIRAGDLAPYIKTAAEWIKEHRADGPPSYALIGLRWLLDGAGKAERAQDIKALTAEAKARVAFARLRDAGVKPERLLAIHMGVTACILDDRGSHDITAYRLVQTAKATHRLASGNHYRGQWPMDDGTTRPLELHYYPHSSGLVLRVMGKALDEISAGVTESALEAIRAAKLAKFGPHPSILPGFKPPWAIAREKAISKANKAGLGR